MRNPVIKPDLESESSVYWNRVLASHGLDMERGNQPNIVSYVGTSNDLTPYEEETYEIAFFDSITGKMKNSMENGCRRVRPKGSCPDSFERDE